MKYGMHSLLFIMIFAQSFSMENNTNSAKNKVIVVENTNQARIIQIYNELNIPKTVKDCQQILQEANELDNIALRSKMPHIIPIHSPWRDSYKTEEKNKNNNDVVQRLHKCPFCDQFSRPEDDRQNYILERNEHSVVLFNRNPYLPLHFLIIPKRHIAKFEHLYFDERQELIQKSSSWLKRLKKLSVSGTNIFFNLESNSGASLPDHAHLQLLSRWNGDSSALTYLIGKDIIEQERKLLLPEFYEPNNGSKLVHIFQRFAELLASQQLDNDDRNDDTCYMCELMQDEKQDKKNLVIERFNHWCLMLYRQGYIAGHLLLSSIEHGKSLPELADQKLEELNTILTHSQKTLKDVVCPKGLNIVINEGKCSGNPFEGHVCCNIVPRTGNDTASTAIICGRPIIEKDLDNLRERLITALNN